MIQFLYWNRMSRTDALIALKEVAEQHDRDLRELSHRHDRLMAHLGLFEIDGPRIEKIPLTPTGEAELRIV